MVETKRKDFLRLITSIIGVFITLFAVILFNQNLLMTFPIGIRMILMILSRWGLFIVPGILMWINKEKISTLGFSKKNIAKQIVVGITIALISSILFTVIPILLGFKDFVGSTQYTKPWQFIYEFVYTIFGVALTEELIFRGYIFHKLIQIKNDKTMAIVVSSIIFGLFHIFNGNVLQIITTSMLGILYCVLREKIKNCTTLSLILIHGIHNALITLWVYIL